MYHTYSEASAFKSLTGVIYAHAHAHAHVHVHVTCACACMAVVSVAIVSVAPGRVEAPHLEEHADANDARHYLIPPSTTNLLA